MESDVRPATLPNEDDKLLLLNNDFCQSHPLVPPPSSSEVVEERRGGGTLVTFQVPVCPTKAAADSGAIIRRDLLHTLVAAIVVGTATVLAVLFPNILTRVNYSSDAYCLLFFVSLTCWLVSALAVVVARFFCSQVVLKPPVPVRRLLKLGMYYGISGLAIFYGRDRYRVLCHLQDPLAAAVLPAAVVCHLFFSAKVDSIRKLVCIAAAIIGLFICVDFQIWDEFSCHGRLMTTAADDGMSWTPDEHAIWAVVYMIGLCLLALAFTILEKVIKGDKTKYVVTTIPMLSSMTGRNVAFIEESPTRHGEPPSSAILMSVPRLPGVSSLTFAQTLVLCMWVQLIGWITVLSLFWTDLFAFLGKAGSVATFHEMMVNGLGCFFGIGSLCPNYTNVAWMFVLAYSALFVAVVYLIVVADNCSVAYVFTVLTLALPLSTLWWSFFQDGMALYWYPMFTGETGFTLVGFPIMVAALVLYRYYASREATA